MEATKRKKRYLITAIVFLSLAIGFLIATIFYPTAWFMFGDIAFWTVGVILLIVYIFKNKAEFVTGILFSTLFVVFLICTLAQYEEYIWGAVPCFVVGSLILLDCLMKKLNSAWLTLPVFAVLFSFSCVPNVLLGAVLYIFEINILFYIMAVLFPIVGIILGICALAIRLEDKKQRKVYLGLAVTSIAFPVLAVIVSVILLSSGVFIISLM